MPDQILIYPQVILGPDVTIEEFCILGKPPRQRQPGELPLHIGAGSVIRAFTVIYAGSTLGERLNTGHGALIREDNMLGDGVSVGTHATLEFGNRIGHRVRIHSGCFLERVVLEDDVFVGPNVVFTDDPHPPCPRYLECKQGATVGRHSRIGANSTLLPGIRIGRNCLIGAGSLVAHDIPDNSVAAGNPARVVKRIDELTCWPGFYAKPYEWVPED